MSGGHVISIFEQTIAALRGTYPIEKADGTVRYEPYLLPKSLETFPTLFNILKFCYGDDSVDVSWKMYKDDQPQMQIAFKHIAHGLETLRASHKGRLEAATHLSEILAGFQHCQSRQAMVLNQTLVAMGKSNLDVSGREGPLWSLINAFKWAAFTRFAGDVGDRTHEYARQFTVINTAIGLPVVIQSFRERISGLGNGEINEHLATFFQGFFTKEQLIDYVTQKILTKNSETADTPLDEIAKNPFAYQNVRTLLLDLSGESGDPSKDPVAYFKTLAGILEDDQDEWDYETTPLSPGEIEALLQAIGCLKRS